MAAPSDRQPLNDLPTNTSPRKASGQNPPLEHRPFSYHRELLRSKVSHSKGETPQYVSPSDGIMSPTTKKLSQLKSKFLDRAKTSSSSAHSKMLDFGAAVENRAATAKSPEKGGKGGKRYNHGLDVPHEHRMPPGWQGM